MPDDLLHKYLDWLKETGGGVGGSKGVGVAEMLESLVEGGSLRRVSQSLGASGMPEWHWLSCGLRRALDSVVLVCRLLELV